MWRFVLFVFALFALPAAALDVPKPVGRVSDFAQLLTARQVAALERKLRQRRASCASVARASHAGVPTT